jgi:hypothetical protein
LPESIHETQSDLHRNRIEDIYFPSLEVNSSLSLFLVRHQNCISAFTFRANIYIVCDVAAFSSPLCSLSITPARNQIRFRIECNTTRLLEMSLVITSRMQGVACSDLSMNMTFAFSLSLFSVCACHLKSDFCCGGR